MIFEKTKRAADFTPRGAPLPRTAIVTCIPARLQVPASRPNRISSASTHNCALAFKSSCRSAVAIAPMASHAPRADNDPSHAGNATCRDGPPRPPETASAQPAR